MTGAEGVGRPPEREEKLREYRRFVMAVRAPLIIGLFCLLLSGVLFAISRFIAPLTTLLGVALTLFGGFQYLRWKKVRKIGVGGADARPPIGVGGADGKVPPK